MANDLPYSVQEFMNSEKEMSKLTQMASKKYRMPLNAVFTKLSDATRAIASGTVNWGRRNSLWPMQFGLSCCAIEFMDFGASRIDSDRRGFLMFRGTPRQCDVMIVAGWVTKSMVPRVKRLYEQMAKPSYVVSFGECATSGGPWWESYNIIKGIDQVLPVDVYVAGCPPRPENLFNALMMLQQKIGGEAVRSSERSVSEDLHKPEIEGLRLP